MLKLYRLAAVSLISSLVSIAPAMADETLAVAAASLPAAEAPVLIIPIGSSKAISTDLNGTHASKASFDTETPAVRVAMCGVEADSGNAGLDAGLIDFRTPDPHAAGRSSEDEQRVGQNVPDYRSSVFLGVTLGYHF